MKNLFLVMTLLIIASCSEKKNGPFTSNKDVKSSDYVGSAFIVSQSKDISTNMEEGRHFVGIHESALEKEFLFEGQLIPQEDVAQFSGLRGRVVAFRKMGQKIHLLEATQGHTVSTDLPQHFHLATFPLLKTKDSFHYIDFAEGMSRVYVSSSMRASDFGKEKFGEFQYLNFSHNFLRKAYISDNNYLVISLVGQFDNRGDLTPIETQFYIRPYRPNPSFRPIESTSFDKMGFFETHLSKSTDRAAKRFAAKFHEDKPILFTISANTPKEYIQAVKDGVLYWNKALGKDLLQVKLADSPITAPNPDHNVIQWVNWDLAGFAYADTQMDPRSGEISHAQVFFTSAFAVGGKAKMRKALQRILESTPKERKILGIRGMRKSPMCLRTYQHSMARDLLSLITESSEETIFRAAKDYITEVVAHEIGHTLGLRHNFAGSLGATIDPDDRDKHFQDYINDDHIEEQLFTSSSVMEYQTFKESVLTGARMRKNMEAAQYDTMAMKALYDPSFKMQEHTPIFCTDSHRSLTNYADCNVFDIGRNLVEILDWRTRNLMDTLPQMVWEKMISLVFPYKQTRKELTNINLEGAKNKAILLANSLKQLLEHSAPNARLLAIERMFNYHGELNKEEISQKTKNVIFHELKELGGVKHFFNILDNKKFVALKDTFQKLEEQYKSGMTADGKVYVFTDEESTYLKNLGLKYIELVKKSLFENILKVLSEEKELADHPLGRQWAIDLFPLAEKIIFSTREETLNETIEMKEKSIDVSLPLFTYSIAERLSAAKFYKKKSKDIIWGFKEKILMKEKLTSISKKNFGDIKIKDIPLSKISLDLAKWLKSYKMLLDKL